jgi:hypothetical protein
VTASADTDLDAADLRRVSSGSAVPSGSLAPESKLSGALGSEAGSVVHGGGTGVVDAGVSSAQSSATADVGELGASQRQGARLGAGATVDAAAQTTGFRDPVSQLSRGEQLELDQRDSVVGRVGEIESAQGEAQRIASDPRAAGAARVQSEVASQVDSHVPGAASKADAAATTAARAVDDPQALAQGEARGKLDAEIREAESKTTASVGVTGGAGGGVSTSVKKPGES